MSLLYFSADQTQTIRLQMRVNQGCFGYGSNGVPLLMETLERRGMGGTSAGMQAVASTRIEESGFSGRLLL